MPKSKPEEASASSESSSDIANDIAEAIAARKLPPGTKLREEALCRVYGVSRTKIRAALLILSKDKLIDIIPDKGAFVSQPTEKEAREIFAVRRIIEAGLAREFVEKARPADYKMLERHLKMERSAVSTDNSKVRSQLLGDFHLLLADVVGNHVLREILKELVGRSSLITMLYQSEVDAACSLDDHVRFLEAAKTGNVDKAVKLMIDHLVQVESKLQFDADPHRLTKDLATALLV